MQRLRGVALALALAPALALASGTEATLDVEPILDPEAAWLEAAAARELAGRDRHHQAARSFLDALAHDARLVPDIVDELAYQKLWREDADRAIFYFRRYLARQEGDSPRDARKGLALALSWSGRQPEAVTLYRELAAEDPADAGAQLGLGRSLLWNNQLRAGFRELRAVETRWAGEPAGRETGRFLLQVLDEYTTPAALRVDASWDSDDLDIYRTALSGAWTTAGDALLEVRPSYAWYRQPGRPDVEAPRLTLGLVAPLSHRWTLHAYGWVDHFRSDAPLNGGDDLDWTQLGGDAWLTWIAHPRLRLDLGGTVQPVETMTALGQELNLRQVSLSADARLTRHLLAVVAGQVADYTDDNVRRVGSARLLWRHEGPVEWRLGPSVTTMDFETPYPGGYWAPDWMRNVAVEGSALVRTGRWVLRAEARYGREREAGSDAIAVGGGAAHVGWRLSPGALLSIDAGYSKSRLATASGWSRTFAGLALRFFY
ncbi:MAG: hypothetical protein R6X25_02635 [Candidatus Krumholzibacteriia bacterium]